MDSLEKIRQYCDTHRVARPFSSMFKNCFTDEVACRLASKYQLDEFVASYIVNGEVEAIYLMGDKSLNFYDTDKNINK